MKKLLTAFLLLLAIVLLNWCNTVTQKPQLNLNNNKSKEFVYIWLSDDYDVSWLWPKLFSGSYHITPKYLYKYKSDIESILKKYYDTSWDNKQVYYYDEYSWRKAAFIVLLLKSIWKNNVSLIVKPKQKLKHYKKFKTIKIVNPITQTVNYSSGYVSYWKYRLVVDISKISLLSWDLLLYTSDKWTMLSDKFYKSFSENNVKNLYWSNLIDINWNPKSKDFIEKIKKDLKLNDYKNIYLYYPKYFWRSAIVALLVD